MERGSARSSFNHMKIHRVFVSPPTRQNPDEIGIGALRNANVRFWPILLQKSDARDRVVWPFVWGGGFKPPPLMLFTQLQLYAMDRTSAGRATNDASRSRF